MNKVLGLGILAAGLLASAFAANRVGPVSQYGQLQAGKNTSGKGQIYGSCKGVTTGNEVQVQGMSLFWSIAGNNEGEQFWNASTVNSLVAKQNIQVIRAPMGVDEDWGNGKGNYSSKTSYHQNMMNSVVQAAIDNDIYVIIDYHSHNAINSKATAATFFEDMASKWGKYDNVIFEVFNEPLEGVSWTSIKSYAEDMLKIIRKYSDNLVVVGNRSWDQYPNDAVSSPINDKNVAYTFHFYAGSHSTGSEGSHAVSAMNSGLSVFVTEWGTVNADGGGSVSKSSSGWLSWMNLHKLSGANWSVNTKNEGASYFSGSAWNYSESGKWVNTNIFANLPTSYTACDGSTSPASSSSAASSSSVVLPAGYTDYIDDFEDGDSLAYTGGEWYAYNDNGEGAASTFSNVATKGGYKVVLTASSTGNTSKYVAGLTNVKLNQGSYEYDPYVALGVKLNSNGSAYDLSKCSTISYKYKGAAHNFKAEDTAVKDYGYHQTSVSAAASWTTASISWNELNQEAWPDPVDLSKSRISKFTWEIKGENPFLNYLYIDDVRCSGWSVKISSSSSVASSSSKVPEPAEGASSSSIPVVVSSSSVAPVVLSSSSVQPVVSSSSVTPVVSSSSVAPAVSSSSVQPVVSSSSVVPVVSSSSIMPVVSSSSIALPPSSSSVQPVVSSSSVVPAVSSSSVMPVVSSSSIAPAVSSSSIAPVVLSSSSVIPVVSSSSATPVVSSSSVQPAISSSSVQPVVSSSSIAPVVSSSSVAPAVSSSSVVPPPSSSSVQPVVSSSSVTPVVSSSSITPSSSSITPSSSSAAPYVITGNMEQSVVRGGTIEPVVITGVNTYSRKSWTITFLEFPENVTDGKQVDNTVTISGTLLSWGKEGDYSEKLKVNGEEIYFTLHVLPKSSSSAQPVASSSSVAPVESSSSAQPVVSSSSEVPAASSSSEMEGPLNVAYSRPAVNLGFSGNTLTVAANNASVKIQIFDLMGNAIESRMERVSGSYVQSLDHLNKGSYLVRVMSGSLVKTARIAIK
ncbi:cellulase family glycosylhydrolase [Fibrobacter sp. UWEL]|uniref:cellulase family glycosylhydrolase n=1 Tax=Fibrobacter sp. UWEL TaxID=1896209 RepID=UPI00091B7B2E|nr:cellulase family glycosylhydrolase [Fibrobacter sp. UWEL]SHL26353.1 Por secretion system C-terminal sorting domain-containing protein [Fibrobacter sp. UWEL]